jgi:hypothetical protein
MLTVKVDPSFCGPTLAELGSTAGDILDDPLPVRWEGTREEAELVGRLRGSRSIEVYVQDLAGMATAACALGALLQVEGKKALEARDALASRKLYDWKRYSGEAGPAAAKALVVKLAADGVRQGMRPRLARIATDVLQGRASPMDADILMRI